MLSGVHIICFFYIVLIVLMQYPAASPYISELEVGLGKTLRQLIISLWVFSVPENTNIVCMDLI